MITSIVVLTAIGLLHGAPAQLAPAHCLRAQSYQAADSIPVSLNFVPSECPQARPAPAFRYDPATRSSRLSRAIADNEVVSSFPEFGQELVQPGQAIAILIVLGKTRIERRVEALQTARPGQSLFVRGSNGQIFSVRYENRP